MTSLLVDEVLGKMPGYVVLFYDGYQDGDDCEVGIHLHGIGESGMRAPRPEWRKTLAQLRDFGGHAWAKKLCDLRKMIWILPQDADADLFGDNEYAQIMTVAKRYSKGKKIRIVTGLSMGAGAILSILMGASTLKYEALCYAICCPPSWQSLDEKQLAALSALKDIPVLIFHGAKDEADRATKINIITSTVYDVMKIGTKKNLYFTVFPDDDHYIWVEVFAAIGRPPVTPQTGAASWTAKHWDGLTDITVKCVNDMLTDIWEYAFMQAPDRFRSLPRISVEAPPAEPDPVVPPPPPLPAPDQQVALLSRIMITGEPRSQTFLLEANYSGKKLEVKRAATGTRFLYSFIDAVLVDGKPMLKAYIRDSKKSDYIVNIPQKILV